jgi:hypothetical protein
MMAALVALFSTCVDVSQPGDYHLQQLFALFRRDHRSAVVLVVNQFTPASGTHLYAAHEAMRPVVGRATPSFRSSNTGRYTFGSCSVCRNSVLIVFQCCKSSSMISVACPSISNEKFSSTDLR